MSEQIVRTIFIHSETSKGFPITNLLLILVSSYGSIFEIFDINSWKNICSDNPNIWNQCFELIDKPGTAQIGAISEAQK